MLGPTQWTFIIAEHMQEFVTAEDTEALEFITAEHTDTQEPMTSERTNTQEPVTSEHTETQELVSFEHIEIQEFVTAEHTDTRGQERVTGTAPGSTTGIETESRYNSTIIITLSLCTIFAFIFGVICGLITDRCVCALLKRKAEQQISTASSNIERSGKTAHFEKDLNESNEADAVYDEIIPHYCKPGIPGIVRMELNENVAYGHV